MAKISFLVETDALIRSLHVAPAGGDATRVPLVEDADGNSTGSVDVAPGSYDFMLVLRAGTPEGEYKLTLRRDALDPVERPGVLDGIGNGGDVGTFSF